MAKASAADDTTDGFKPKQEETAEMIGEIEDGSGTMDENIVNDAEAVEAVDAVAEESVAAACVAQIDALMADIAPLLKPQWRAGEGDDDEATMAGMQARYPAYLGFGQPGFFRRSLLADRLQREEGGGCAGARADAERLHSTSPESP